MSRDSQAPAAEPTAEQLLEKVRRLASVPFPEMQGRLYAQGGHLYNGDDYGSLIATMEDVDGSQVADGMAAAVNALLDIRDLLAGYSQPDLRQ